VVPAGFAILLLCLPPAAVAALWVAKWVGVPYPVLLVGVGVLLSLVPWGNVPQLSPDVVLFGFLPPLVYFAAYFVAPDQLRANAGPISLLSVGVVAATTAAVAGVLMGLAGVPLAVALTAGAIVAPTDTVAATSVFRRLDLPERLVTIVEGEGLTNDGTALVLYVGAVGTVVAGTVRPGSLLVTLIAAPLGGAVLGLAIAWPLVAVRRRLDYPLLEITISLATPYLTYTLGQAAGLSGVLATVVAGTYVGSRSSAIYAPHARLQAFAFLEVLVFVLNAVLFSLLGMQLVRQVHWAPGMPGLRVAEVTAAVIAIVIGLRLGFMLLGPATAKLFGRRRPKTEWSERAVVGWAGMRGGVSLAAALAIPLKVAGGSPFPYRDLVIFLAAAVIVVTLPLQGMTLPLLLRRLGLTAENSRNLERKARLQATQAALAWLDEHVDADAADGAADSVRALYEARQRRLQFPDSSEESSADEAERYQEIRLELLSVERSVVQSLRNEGRINAPLLRTIERDLDLEEARIRDS
jgi:Na+/H+ antiporter